MPQNPLRVFLQCAVLLETSLLAFQGGARPKVFKENLSVFEKCERKPDFHVLNEEPATAKIQETRDRIKCFSQEVSLGTCSVPGIDQRICK